MQHGICTLSMIPCRAEPSSKSEMVNQLLFGEQYHVVELREDWLKIRSDVDQYEGWINARQHHAISNSDHGQVAKGAMSYGMDLVQVIHDLQRNISFPVTAGCFLPGLNHDKQLSFDGLSYSYDGSAIAASARRPVQEILSTAFMFLNAPYLWGGKTPFGIDCSGLVQVVYRLNGYLLPRDADQQVAHGTPLSFAEEAEAGDLAFFDNPDGKIVHVGILLDQNQIIHASGCVRVDRFDHYGIFNQEMGKYSHLLRVIKRIL